MNRTKHSGVLATPKARWRYLAGPIAIAMVAAVFALGSATVASAAAPPAPYSNGFETNTSGWLTSGGSTITRVPSGDTSTTYASAVTTSPSGGSYYARLGTGTNTTCVNGGGTQALFEGPYTDFGGVSSTFPVGGYSTGVDVYLDVPYAIAHPDTRFDWAAAISDTGGNYRRGFMFNVGTDASGFVITGGNNSTRCGADPYSTDPSHAPKVSVTESGWYSLKDTFSGVSGGQLSVQMDLVQLSSNTVVGTWTRSDPSDIIGTTVGGNNSGSFDQNEFDGLAIDNSTRSGQCTSVCYVDAAAGNDANSGVSPSDAKKTIQAAVNTVDVNGQVIVAAGTYGELVTVNKAVTIDGAQVGVDAQTRSGSESIVEGNAGGSTAFYVTANDVTIDGFTVQNQTNANQFGAGIVLGAGTSHASIVNNVVTSNMDGLFLANGGPGQTLIQHNVFSDNNNTGPASGTGIYTDQYVAGGTVSNVLIDANTFTGQNDAGIGFSSTDASAPDTNVTISGNTFDGNGRGLYAFNLTSSTITGNTFQNATDSATADVRIFEGDNTLSINHNILKNGAGRAYRASNASTGSPDPTGILLNRNAITGYTGPASTVQNDTTPQLNATCNWWGSASGPGSPASTASSNVDTSMWLLSNTLTGPCSGGTFTFLGYQSPLPKTKLSATNSTIPVKFKLGDASGNPLPASIASTVVTRVTLTGPSASYIPGATALTSIEPCPYNKSAGVFKCNLAKPRTVSIGAQWYWIATTVKIGSTYVLPTNFGGAINPEMVTFKK
jgi:parallel beta-helix repeat protein